MELWPISLQKDSVVLRPFEERDIAAVMEVGTDLYTTQTTTVPLHGDEAAALSYILRQRQRQRDGVGWSLAIAEADSEARGQIGLWPQKHQTATLGYWLAPSARGRGLASTALAALSSYGVQHFARLELYIEPWNEASWRLAERVGYMREGLLRSHQEIAGTRRDMYLYALLPEGA